MFKITDTDTVGAACTSDIEEAIPMELTQSKKRIQGLTAFQIKVIALISMTLDHIGAFAWNVPVVARYEGFLRIIGRLAAPLFLFLLVQSIRHTRSKPRFVLRLYLAGMCVELFVTAMNVCFGEVFSYFTPGNILFTFFYTALYVLLLERIISAWKDRKLRALACSAGLLALSGIPTVLSLSNVPYYLLVPPDASIRVRFLITGIWNSLLPSFNSIDYGIGFSLLGVILYFAGTKNRQCFVFAAFCLVCIAGARMAPDSLYSLQSFGFFPTFFDRFQCRMIYALPIMQLYNGEPGKKCKWFFYGYYPLHREAIYLMANWLAG